MKQPLPIPEQFLAHARRSLCEHHLPRIARCLRMLSEEEVWWRPNPTSNSAGNLVLHLEGNVRQWIVSGLGGKPDRRQRDLEFTKRGPLPRRTLLAQLRKTVAQAVRVIEKLPGAALSWRYRIQRFRVTGLQAVCHVMEHFAHHSGQIIYITKLNRGVDLGFTSLPSERARKTKARHLPTI